MAKQGQHRKDRNDPAVSRGPNNPTESQVITTGTPKKRETYAERARAHEDPEPVAQAAQHEWKSDTRDQEQQVHPTRARHPRSGRSGSDSNASAGTRGH